MYADVAQLCDGEEGFWTQLSNTLKISNLQKLFSLSQPAKQPNRPRRGHVLLDACTNGQVNKTNDKTNMKELPTFKYNPNAERLGILKKEKTTCPVCGQDRNYVYQGPFYCIDEVEGICPWCIKDGSAAKKYDGEFQDAAPLK